MSIINLADAKVLYEGQTLPAINLISKLQVQLQEAASHMAAIASALGELQTALLNSHTVEVKLTLSKEDLGRFRSLGGGDDNERIRKAIMTVIHSEARDTASSEALNIQPQLASAESAATTPPIESQAVIPEMPHPVLEAIPEIRQQPDMVSESKHESMSRRKNTTKCPRCQSLIELPEVTNDQWSVEVKCSACGAKCLVKSRSTGVAKSDNAGFEPLDEAAYGKFFDMLSA